MSMCIGTRPERPSTEPDDVDGLAADRHAVGDPHDAVVGVERGLEHERVVDGTAARPSAIPPAGAISHRPLLRSPSSAAKTAPESNRGTHSQSIEPSLPTSAAVCVSPIRA